MKGRSIITTGNPSARGIQLGARARAARILGDDHLDAVFAQQGQFARRREGAAIHDQMMVGPGRRRGGIDEAQQVEMLRGLGKVADGLAAKCQEHARRVGAERSDRLFGIRHADPAITGAFHPFGSGQREQRHARPLRRRNRIGADPRGEGVGRVDQMRHAFALQVIGQPLDPAEPADAYRDRLGAGVLGAARIAQHRAYPALRQRGGQRARLGRAAEQKDMAHG